MKKIHADGNQVSPDSAIEIPFSVNLPDPSASSTPLICEKLLRHLPGKRLACLAHWDDKEVFAKLFIDPHNAKRDWQRDAKGTQALHDHGIIAPAILYSGPLRAAHGEFPKEAYLLIFERIAPAQTLLEVWNEGGESIRLGLLSSLVRILATHHNAGLVHGDLHFANFMAQGNTIFTLDGGQIAIFSRPVSKPRSLRNLALLFAEIPPRYARSVEELFTDYQTLRGWPHEQAGIRKLHHYIHAARAHRKHKILRKIFRECSAFVCHKQLRRLEVYDRDYDSVQLRRLLDDPDSFLSSTSCTLIKRGNTATLGIIEIDGRKLVIKRYNIKNFWHACKRALQSTRAAICWRNAHLLGLYEISTPQPVALLEVRLGPLRSTSYFISRYVEGPDCAQYFSGDAALADSTAVLKNFSELFDKLAEARITHGDLKATNIIISNGQPVLLDLDAVCQHRFGFRFKKAFARDMQRFLRNWNKSAVTRRRFEACLPVFVYGPKAPPG
ncbi:MAG: lipopolysaccharide kinase InaA family protein [Gammaproteobacteria bacterium]